MVSLEILGEGEGSPQWSKDDDLLDLTAKIQVFMNGNPLPVKYFPGGLDVHLYETTFELLDLLGNIVKVIGAGEKRTESIYQAELCYSGSFLTAQVIDEMTIRAALQFNPISVDDDALLAGSSDYQEQVSLESLATEILSFAISVYETIADFNPDLEPSLVDLQSTILDYQERLEKEFSIKILPPVLDDSQPEL
ncbi:MAG TPA: hypothetical protein VKM55_16815 [Candidatus Lokiarchaeia archaeon]|nr:hypothetical protein [Candidatus Lokiarchaeia archaeon]